MHFLDYGVSEHQLRDAGANEDRARAAFVSAGDLNLTV
jgi:hypothetical protein